MTTITKERIELFIKSPLENGLTRGEQMELARIALVSLDAEPVSQPYKLPEEKGASLQLRNLIRKRHAEWSDSTFGNVGPVGPLKHLSKEALEAAAEPGDLSEWADMQFLLWDAQRRAGISDGEITAAMEEKLKVNMARQWPEPKDGEPRLHIKEQPAPVVPAEMPKGLAGQIVSLLAHNIGDKFLAQKIWYACRAAMLQAEPVSNSDELPLDYLQGHKDGLEWAAQLAEANHPQTGDWLYDDPIDLARAIRKGPDMPTVQAGNSPVTPDGWVMVPKEPTQAMIKAWLSEIANFRGHAAGYRAALEAAPQQEVNRG
ncbi:DUF550 domain-containing protein [Salmonella enterica subsp. enterica serovar Alachua]|uniref:DUF550 domain-containing protein n=1 Tax=Salmonella enterica TaxID=28901 RepID=UPI0007C99142|nr:DUF550 domain-containing protein [Salmonella enterica]EAA7638629.1 DUF550 domain-containing protein [Salmonella enterica subsp. enterica]EAA8523845.1 DUF550 domain-containing protein [Salmonella enterica subsp. enterica serovar Cerro]EAN8631218.1 DUF550 domain-containing protein [Salmonella enterica subsp. enterica serovar Adelaide]EBV2691863.1 DUF550 domain-containing protein [Salmonella enterica subsp. enterica serovar Monschaui]ECT7523570.1 DUF550 domain-containing protein [Salmonella en